MSAQSAEPCDLFVRRGSDDPSKFHPLKIAVKGPFASSIECGKVRAVIRYYGGEPALPGSNDKAEIVLISYGGDPEEPTLKEARAVAGPGSVILDANWLQKCTQERVLLDAKHQWGRCLIEVIPGGNNKVKKADRPSVDIEVLDEQRDIEMDSQPPRTEPMTSSVQHDRVLHPLPVFSAPSLPVRQGLFSPQNGFQRAGTAPPLRYAPLREGPKVVSAGSNRFYRPQPDLSVRYSFQAVRDPTSEPSLLPAEQDAADQGTPDMDTSPTSNVFKFINPTGQYASKRMHVLSCDPLQAQLKELIREHGGTYVEQLEDAEIIFIDRHYDGDLHDDLVKIQGRLLLSDWIEVSCKKGHMLPFSDYYAFNYLLNLRSPSPVVQGKGKGKMSLAQERQRIEPITVSSPLSSSSSTRKAIRFTEKDVRDVAQHVKTHPKEKGKLGEYWADFAETHPNHSGPAWMEFARKNDDEIRRLIDPREQPTSRKRKMTRRDSSRRVTRAVATRTADKDEDENENTDETEDEGDEDEYVPGGSRSTSL